MKRNDEGKEGQQTPIALKLSVMLSVAALIGVCFLAWQMQMMPQVKPVVTLDLRSIMERAKYLAATGHPEAISDFEPRIRAAVAKATANQPVIVLARPAVIDGADDISLLVAQSMALVVEEDRYAQP